MTLTVKIDEDHPNENKQRQFFLEFTIARETVITWVLQRLRQTESWESFVVEKTEGLGLPFLEAVGMGMLEVI